jgi:hypothetical protein
MPTRTDLLCKAKELGLKGYTAMSKAALEKFVEENMPKTVRVKRIKKKAVEPMPEPAPAPVKRIKVRKPKVVNPMAAVDEAREYLEQLEQKRVAKGVAKLKKTVSKGIVKSAVERAIIKYKLNKAMKADDSATNVDDNIAIIKKIWADKSKTKAFVKDSGGEDSERSYSIKFDKPPSSNNSNKLMSRKNVEDACFKLIPENYTLEDLEDKWEYEFMTETPKQAISYMVKMKIIED